MTNAITATPATHTQQVPVSMPAYLSDYLSTLQIPNTIQRHFLEKVGKDVLEAKRAEAILENAGLPARLQNRIPTKIPFDEAALVLLYLFTFKNIRVSVKSKDTLLGMYVTEGPDEGIYTTDRHEFYRLLDPIVPYFRQKDMDDVLDRISRVVSTEHQTADKDLFIVKNGVYNKKTKTLEPYSSQYVYLTKIPIDYKDAPANPILIADDGYKWDVDTWIKDLAVDDETYTLIWQVIADAMQPSYSRRHSIWFYSESGNNGKGTLGQLIKNILGPNNYSSLAVNDFKHEFLKESLIGVAANIADENDVDTYVDTVRDYKASITGDDINVNRKYQDPLRIQFSGINIQMLNGLPKTRDKSDSFYRRLILVPFIKSFTNNGERPYIKNVYIKKPEVLEYVLWQALQLDFDDFIKPQRSLELLDEYKEMNNPIIQFWEELREVFVWDLLPTQFLYDLYREWTFRNNPVGKPLNKRSFIESLKQYTKDDDIWEPRFDQDQKVKTGTRMDEIEELIMEYDLTKWMDSTYRGTSINKRLNFKKSLTYRGLLRR